VKIHDFPFNRTPGRIGPEAINAHNNFMRVAIDKAFVRQSNVNDRSIDRTNHPQRGRWHRPDWITKYEKQVSEHSDEQHGQQWLTDVPGDPGASNRGNQKWNALPGDKRITASFQSTPPAFCINSILFLFFKFLIQRTCESCNGPRSIDPPENLPASAAISRVEYARSYEPGQNIHAF
jgi:hypothetical protein